MMARMRASYTDCCCAAAASGDTLDACRPNLTPAALLLLLLTLVLAALLGVLGLVLAGLPGVLSSSMACQRWRYVLQGSSTSSFWLAATARGPAPTLWCKVVQTVYTTHLEKLLMLLPVCDHTLYSWQLAKTGKGSIILLTET